MRHEQRGVRQMKKRADELVGKIIEKFWDGEKWIAYNAETGVKSDSLNISLYMPCFWVSGYLRRLLASVLRLYTVPMALILPMVWQVKV
jgi:hypothetical protein